MRAFFAIALLFCHLVSATEAHQLLKIPALVSHYHQYSAHHHKGNLADFLHDHYLHNPDAKGEDNQRHEDLPFHGHHEACMSISPVMLPPMTLTQLSAPAEPATSQGQRPQVMHSSHEKDDVWQPPRA